jgi:hypothetical protein
MPRISNFYFDEEAFALLSLEEQLWHCVQQSEFRRAEKLLAAGAGPNLARGVWHNTPLHLAVLVDNTDMVTLLLKNYCSVDERNHAGTTPLMLAVKAQNFDVVKDIAHRGANAHRKDCEGKSPIMMAQEAADRNASEDAQSILFDLQRKFHCLPARPAKAASGEEGGAAATAADDTFHQYLARLHSVPKEKHHTLSKADKDAHREKKGTREQEALAAAKREEADIKAHYDGHGHGAA